MPDLSFLHTVFDGVQKKLGDLVMAAIWGGVAFLGKLAYDWVQAWHRSRKQAKQSNPAYLAEKQIALSLAADRACRWAGAAHTSIYQFHNGQFFANGDSIQKASMVGEAVENNALARWLGQSQSLPLAGFPYLMRALGKGHVWLYRDQCEDYELNNYMHKRGYTSRVVCLLTGAKGAWLGLLIISFAEGYFTDEHLNLTTLEEHRRACASILANT